MSSLATQRRRELSTALLSINQAKTKLDYARLQAANPSGDDPAWTRLFADLDAITASLNAQLRDWRAIG